MNKNKSGFVSMTLVYTFLIIFLFLMLAILNTYNTKNKYMEAIDSKVDKDIKENRESKDGILNRLITDNSPEYANNIKYHKIASLALGNGNGLYYSSDASIFDENADGALENRVYFFRGEVENNYLIMKNNDNQSICFRIIRTDENGNLRIMYAGEASGNKCSNHSTGKSIGTLAFNTYNIGVDEVDSEFGVSPLDERFAHYIYERSGNDRQLPSPASNVKTNIDGNGIEDWFDENFKSNPNIVDAYYCNNTSSAGSAGVISYYNAHNLLTEIINPDDLNEYSDNYKLISDFTLRCTNIDDRYSLTIFAGGSLSFGNQLLSAPVGLITAEEVVLAGGGFDKTNGAYYMAREIDYWTMSPYSYDGINGAKMVYVTSEGSLSSRPVNESIHVIPVITIKKSARVGSGNGRYDSPYIITNN